MLKKKKRETKNKIVIYMGEEDNFYLKLSLPDGSSFVKKAATII